MHLRFFIIKAINTHSNMETLIIQSENPSDIKLLKELVFKLGLKSASLSTEQVEDLGLSILMREADLQETVSRQSIMEVLDK